MLMRLWWKWERACHLVDAYLARDRGDVCAYMDAKARAQACERRLDIIRIA